MRIPSLLLLPGLLQAQVPEVRSTAADRTGLALTVYQDGWGLVRDQRRLFLPQGFNRVAFSDVAASLLPESAMVAGPGAALGERHFAFDLLSPHTLSRNRLGNSVAFRPRIDGPLQWGLLEGNPAQDETVVVGESLGHSAMPVAGLVHPALPSDLRARPTLLQDLDSPHTGVVDLSLAYLTQGLRWSARYVATLAPDLKSMDLDAYVLVRNESGADFRRATLSLLAGEVNRLPPPDPPPGPREAAATVEVVASALPKEESLADYHLYTLHHPVDLPDQTQKQMVLFQAHGVSLRPEIRMNFLLGHGSDILAEVPPPAYRWARLRNRRSQGLGRPLPAGDVALMLPLAGTTIPAPESADIPNTAIGEDLDLPLGPAAGLGYQILDFDEDLDSHTTREQILVFNDTPRRETIRFRIYSYGPWKLLEVGAPRRRLDAFDEEAVFSLAPGATRILTIRARRSS